MPGNDYLACSIRYRTQRLANIRFGNEINRNKAHKVCPVYLDRESR